MLFSDQEKATKKRLLAYQLKKIYTDLLDPITVPRKTLRDAASQQCLEYVNAIGEDEEQQENLLWHTQLLLGQVRACYEIDIYHRSYPWKVILALNPAKWNELLHDMKDTWSFVTQVIDPLPLSHNLAKHLAFTRYQPFRDVMVKAEPLGSKQPLITLLSL